MGKKEQDTAQKAEMKSIWRDLRGAGTLDYVTCWYRIAAAYMKGMNAAAAFVSTNSICQGEQVGVLWNEMYSLGIVIRFAHRTFAWTSERVEEPMFTLSLSALVIRRQQQGGCSSMNPAAGSRR